jgi:hypothetical protein
MVCLDRSSPHFRAVENAGAWDESTDPKLMLPLLAGWSSLRKLRLLACAIVRHAPFGPDGRTIWDLVLECRWYHLHSNRGGGPGGPDCREVIELAERRTDGLVSDDLWREAQEAAHYATWAAEADTFGYDREAFVGSGFRYSMAQAIAQTCRDDRDRLNQYLVDFRTDADWVPGSVHEAHDQTVCLLIDDLHGNPFRPGIVRRDCVTDAAMDLAQSIYQDRAFDLMPVLADALEEAGCPAGEILRHCRRPGPHARGCWVLDQVTQREWLPPYRPPRGSTRRSRP